MGLGDSKPIARIRSRLFSLRPRSLKATAGELNSCDKFSPSYERPCVTGVAPTCFTRRPCQPDFPGGPSTQSDLAASLGRLYPATKSRRERRDALNFPLKNRPAGRMRQLALMDSSGMVRGRARAAVRSAVKTLCHPALYEHRLLRKRFVGACPSQGVTDDG
jgi:hypothetical protein